MQNYIINNTIKAVDSFPPDNRIRVVWAYGAVYRNLGPTRVPEIDIMLKEVLPNGELSETQIFVKVSVAQLDIVRYMSVWKGNQRTTDFWNNFKAYKENILFSINTAESTVIKFTDKNPDSGFWYFPIYKYKMDLIEPKTMYWHFANATFTKLKTKNGITVLIPSMEFLTSTYVPHEQQIRYKLLQKNLDDILDEYIKSSKIEHDTYHIELYGSKVDTNIAFLAYAKFNQQTRQRLSKLRESLERSDNNFKERYPTVLPYHPSNMDIEGDGIWLDNKTFFMFRVNNYSLPEDHVVESYALELKFEIDKSKEKSHYHHRLQQDFNKDEALITNRHNPHLRNASVNLISEVSVLNRHRSKIKHTKEKLNIRDNAEIDLDMENISDITHLSSGEADQTGDSRKTAKIRITAQNEDKTHLNQSEVLKMVIETLYYMRDEELDISSNEKPVYIKEIYFVDEMCKLNTEQMSTQFSRVLKRAKRKTNLWVLKRKNINHKREFFGYRNYLFVKIVLDDGRSAYIFEIDRKNNDNGFLGMILRLDYEMNSGFLVDFLSKVMKKEGVVKNIQCDGMKQITFKHHVKNGTLNDNISRKIKEAIIKNLFDVYNEHIGL